MHVECSSRVTPYTAQARRLRAALAEEPQGTRMKLRQGAHMALYKLLRHLDGHAGAVDGAKLSGANVSTLCTAFKGAL